MPANSSFKTVRPTSSKTSFLKEVIQSSPPSTWPPGKHHFPGNQTFSDRFVSKILFSPFTIVADTQTRGYFLSLADIDPTFVVISVFGSNGVGGQNGGRQIIRSKPVPRIDFIIGSDLSFPLGGSKTNDHKLHSVAF